MSIWEIRLYDMQHAVNMGTFPSDIWSINFFAEKFFFTAYLCTASVQRKNKEWKKNNQNEILFLQQMYEKAIVKHVSD